MKFWNEIRQINGLDIECFFYEEDHKYDCKVYIRIDGYLFYGASHHFGEWKYSSTNNAFDAAVAHLKSEICRLTGSPYKNVQDCTQWLISFFERVAK